jgi:hypothetical protein
MVSAARLAHAMLFEPTNLEARGDSDTARRIGSLVQGDLTCRHAARIPCGGAPDINWTTTGGW